MDELTSLLAELENEEAHTERILQRIGEKLINEYVIQVGDVTLDPVLVEAYYWRDDKRFNDTSVHAAKSSDADSYKLARKRQKNNFGELYIHFGRSGADVVLSQGNYFLSFLIKNALDNNGEFKKQIDVCETICKDCGSYDACNKGENCCHYGEKILKKVPSKNMTVVFTIRKGIAKDCEFKNKELAALPIDIIKEYYFTAGKSRTAIIEEYIKGKLRHNPGEKELSELKELARGMVSWSKCVEE